MSFCPFALMPLCPLFCRVRLGLGAPELPAVLEHFACDVFHEVVVAADEVGEGGIFKIAQQHFFQPYARQPDAPLPCLPGRGDKEYYIRGTYTANNLDFSEDVLAIADLGFDQISVEPRQWSRC